jgi:hypothetical protein
MSSHEVASLKQIQYFEQKAAELQIIIDQFPNSILLFLDSSARPLGKVVREHQHKVETNVNLQLFRNIGTWKVRLFARYLSNLVKTDAIASDHVASTTIPRFIESEIWPSQYIDYVHREQDFEISLKYFCTLETVKNIWSDQMHTQLLELKQVIGDRQVIIVDDTRYTGATSTLAKHLLKLAGIEVINEFFFIEKGENTQHLQQLELISNETIPILPWSELKTEYGVPATLVKTEKKSLVAKPLREDNLSVNNFQSKNAENQTLLSRELYQNIRSFFRSN